MRTSFCYGPKTVWRGVIHHHHHCFSRQPDAAFSRFRRMGGGVFILFFSKFSVLLGEWINFVYVLAWAFSESSIFLFFSFFFFLLFFLPSEGRRLCAYRGALSLEFFFGSYLFELSILDTLFLSYGRTSDGA